MDRDHVALSLIHAIPGFSVPVAENGSSPGDQAHAVVGAAKAPCIEFGIFADHEAAPDIHTAVDHHLLSAGRHVLLEHQLRWELPTALPEALAGAGFNARASSWPCLFSKRSGNPKVHTRAGSKIRRGHLPHKPRRAWCPELPLNEPQGSAFRTSHSNRVRSRRSVGTSAAQDLLVCELVWLEAGQSRRPDFAGQMVNLQLWPQSLHLTCSDLSTIVSP
jgi:hypothetical protein